MARDLSRATGGILSYFARHRTAANLLLLVLLLSGFYAIPQMRAQFFPDVIVDDVNISVTWDGRRCRRRGRRHRPGAGARASGGRGRIVRLRPPRAKAAPRSTWSSSRARTWTGPRTT